MVTIQVNNLIDFVAEVFSHSESSPEESRRIATYLTTANLTGHDSHGVIRVPVYIKWKKMGSVVPNQNAEVIVDTPSLYTEPHDAWVQEVFDVCAPQLGARWGD